ncbi:MAG TPA: hypothetical protein VKB86_16385, partial [Pyrinomonadaceae bacterium]|nr:hypothetical protein [Pyrinomonadaceae bacterium]
MFLIEQSSFWQDVQMVAGVGSAFHWLALGFVVLALILAALVPAERRRIRAATFLLLLSVAGVFFAAALVSYGSDPATSTAYRWVRWAALFVLWIAIINLASVVIFDVLLGAVRLKPPRILRDLLIAFSYIIVAITLLSKSGVD